MLRKYGIIFMRPVCWLVGHYFCWLISTDAGQWIECEVCGKRKPVETRDDD